MKRELRDSLETYSNIYWSNTENIRWICFSTFREKGICFLYVTSVWTLVD